MGKRDKQQPPDDDGEHEAGTGKKRPFPIHEHIGRRLKDMFDQVAAEPVPDKIRQLLEELERRKPKS